MNQQGSITASRVGALTCMDYNPMDKVTTSLNREKETIEEAQRLYLSLCATFYKKHGYVYQSGAWVHPDYLTGYDYWKRTGSVQLQAWCNTLPKHAVLRYDTH